MSRGKWKAVNMFAVALTSTCQNITYTAMTVKCSHGWKAEYRKGLLERDGCFGVGEGFMGHTSAGPWCYFYRLV